LIFHDFPEFPLAPQIPVSHCGQRGPPPIRNRRAVAGSAFEIKVKGIDSRQCFTMLQYQSVSVAHLVFPNQLIQLKQQDLGGEVVKHRMGQQAGLKADSGEEEKSLRLRGH
jgi:hypothetical protein